MFNKRVLGFIMLFAVALTVGLWKFPRDGDMASHRHCDDDDCRNRPLATDTKKSVHASPPLVRATIQRTEASEHAALRRRTSISAALADQEADAPPPDLPAAIDELIPLLRQCYDLGVQEQPDLGPATALVNLNIAGDGLGGGVVEHSAIAEGSENMTPSFSQCVTETMYRMKVSSPEGVGSVSVFYPIHFRGSRSPPQL